jgi:ATP-dependent protease Clp ATPase subunit
MNLMELRLEPLAIEPLGSVGTVSFSDSMMTYIWFLSALVFVQAGYVGKDVESILYKLLMVRI